VRRWIGLAVYLALGWLFAGRYGILACACMAALWVYLRPPRWILWAASVGFMCAAPIAILVQGLPGSGTLGGSFGTQHMAAHVLVGLSLAAAGLAGLVDLQEELRVRRRSEVPPPEPKTEVE
jgi:hypothetical protein